jgi:hypothetical protein
MSIPAMFMLLSISMHPERLWWLGCGWEVALLALTKTKDLDLLVRVGALVL